MKKTLSVPEVAEELGISERAVWQRIYRNQLPHRRWGRRVFILAAELEEFLAALPGATMEKALDHTEDAL